MGNPILLLESTTADNFDPVGYKLANPDVANAGVDPREHFRTHGIHESRMQINSELTQNGGYRKEKFAFFSQVLDVPPNQSVAYFPAFIGTKHYDLEQYQHESGNAEFGPFVREIEQNPTRRYLNLGCGLRKIHFENCLYLEVYPSISADIIVDPDRSYPIKSGSLDGIGCFAVLEHTRHPWRVVEEINRMLKPGGRVFIDWPFLQPVHGFPSHYFNATREGLKSLFVDNGFEVEVARTDPHGWPSQTVKWILGKLLHDLPAPIAAEIRSMTVAELLTLEPLGDFWRRAFAHVPDSTMSEFACGNTFIGRKKDPH